MRAMSIPGTRWHEYDIRELTVAQVLSRQVRERPDKVYLRTTDGVAMTYAQVDRATNQIANWAHALGATRDTHVAVMMDNGADSLLAMIALAKAGIVAVPLNVNARGPQLAHYLNLSDARWIIADRRFAEQVGEVAALVPAVETIIMAQRDVGDDVTPTGFARVLALSDWQSASEAPIGDVTQHADLAFILFTS